MPRRTATAVAAALAALLVTSGLVGCSGDDDAGGAPSAGPSPTAVGDPALVEVLDPGTGERRVLTLAVEARDETSTRLRFSQRISRDQASTEVPPITVPITSTVTAVEGEGGDATITATQAYGEPTVDATGLDDADVAGVRRALAALGGATSTLVVRPDGTTVRTDDGGVATRAVDGQLRELVPVLPSEAVGAGARWTATTVEQVDGATVDQVATYSLAQLDGDDYRLEVTAEQTYRAGDVEGVRVQSGRATVSATLTGSLGRLLPTSATGTTSTQVVYVVAGRVSDVSTTVNLSLTSA